MFLGLDSPLIRNSDSRGCKRLGRNFFTEPVGCEPEPQVRRGVRCQDWEAHGGVLLQKDASFEDAAEVLSQADQQLNGGARPDSIPSAAVTVRMGSAAETRSKSLLCLTASGNRQPFAGGKHGAHDFDPGYCAPTAEGMEQAHEELRLSRCGQHRGATAAPIPFAPANGEGRAKGLPSHAAKGPLHKNARSDNRLWKCSPFPREKYWNFLRVSLGLVC
jgi:hypothetical protein